MDSAGFLVVVVIVVIVAAVALTNRSRNNESGAITVSLSPKAAVDRVTVYMVERGFALSYKGEETATFTRSQRPSNDIGCLLLLAGIVPGLLYYGLFRRTLTTTVLATEGPAGTNLLLSGDDANARYTLQSWAKETIAPPVATPESRREPCWKCGYIPSHADVRCPDCGAWLRPAG